MTDKNTGVNFPQFISKLAAVFKANPDKMADLMDSLDHQGVDRIPDQWNEPMGEHKAPSRAEVLTGPAVKMSGGGLEPMIQHNSDMSKQEGLTATYADFHNMLKDFGKAMEGRFDTRFKALANVVHDMAKAQAAFEAVLKAAAGPAAKAEPTEETFFSKAETKLEKARKALRKADLSEDEEDAEARKGRLTEIADLLKSATKLIAKADDEDDADEDKMEKAVATAKALSAKVTAALAVITKAEEDEKKEEEEKAEKARAAADATKKAEGTEASTEDEEKDDTAKALEAFQATMKAELDKIQGALTGHDVLKTNLDNLMQVVAGTSRSLVSPPNMTVVKGGQDAGSRFQAAVDEGVIPEKDVFAGQSILSHMKTPGFPQDRLNDEIAVAPLQVRQFFAAA